MAISIRSNIINLAVIALLLGSGSHAFQPSVKSRAPRNPKSALTSDYVSTYADTAIVDRGDPFSFDPSEVSSQQAVSKPALELFGEAFGTFWIVGIGSIASMWATFVNPFMTLQQVAMIWSAAVTSAILMTSPLSGAHLNPVFTIIQAIFRNFNWKKVVPYCLAQLVGSIAGSALSFGLFRSVIRGFEQTEGLVRASSIDSARVFGEYFHSSLSPMQAFGIEAAGTAILAAIVFAVTHKRNADKEIPVPFVVGGTVFSLINLLAPLTQCGMNPARDFGPRIVAFLAGWTDVAFQNCWVYIAGPLVGAVVGASLIDKLFYAKENETANMEAAACL